MKRITGVFLHGQLSAFLGVGKIGTMVSSNVSVAISLKTAGARDMPLNKKLANLQTNRSSGFSHRGIF